MRIEKRDDGWWIVDVPPYTVDGVVYTSCGPYATKALANDDKRGLARFFRQHPAARADPPVAQEAEPPAAGPSVHWFTRSLVFRTAGLRTRRPRKPAAGQQSLPGMEDEEA